MTRIRVSTMFITLMVSLPLSVQAAVDEHTIAVWFFNEGQGDTVADSSGHGHDGVFNGKPEWVKGGLRFPGDNSGYVVVDSSPIFEVAELTIEARVKVEASTGKWQGIICKQQAGCTNRNYGIWVHIDQQVLHAEIGAGGACAFNIQATTVITDDEWHYLAFTFDGEMGRVYVDGVLETEKPYSTPPFFSDDPITIGVPNLDNANGLKGIIDEARISDIARTEEELKEAMEVGLEALLSVTPCGRLVTTWAGLKR